MKKILGLLSLSLLLLLLLPDLSASPLSAPASKVGNDVVLLYSGEKIAGRILSQNKKTVIMMADSGHLVIPKHDIQRIYDDSEGHLAFTDLLPKKGSFPPWWVPAYDLFFMDWLKTFEQIPATVIESGELKNVPYLSFRANKDFELNIYGDPEHPAGLEIGVYGRRRSDPETQKMLREFMTSYLHSMKEIRALESLPASGGRVSVDGMTLAILPPDSEDAYGGWWVSLCYPKALAKAKVPDSKLDAVTQTHAEIVQKTASATSWDKKDMEKSQKKLAKKTSRLIYQQ